MDEISSFLVFSVLVMHFLASVAIFTAQNLSDFLVYFSFLKIEIFLFDDHL
jgi:hypothetical protein